jgi:hypothetical protein
MAAVVKCECCGKVVSYKEAMHIRTYPLSSATTYRTAECKDAIDVCKECYKKSKACLGKEAE